MSVQVKQTAAWCIASSSVSSGWSWQALEALRASVAGEVEATHKQLSGVRAELAPWEAKIAAAKSRLDVATAERDLLLKQGADAQQRLKVLLPEMTATAGTPGSQAGSAPALVIVSRLNMAAAKRCSLCSQRYMQCPRPPALPRRSCVLTIKPWVGQLTHFQHT